MIYEALAYKVVVTKRDMYYRNVQLFGKQSVVDTVSLFPFTCDAQICITKLLSFRLWMISLVIIMYQDHH